MVEFLLTLFFTASDRRYVNALPMLRWMSLLLTNNKSLTAGELQYFVREWTQLIAQIARRKWENETRQLMDGLFVFLVREKDFALTRSTLMNIVLHFQMYAGWDGFANAFKLYAPWQNFMLVLLDQAVSSRRSQQQREQIGSLVLRTQRDLITAVARLTMQEEMTVYGEWLQFGLSAAKSEKNKIRVRRLVQLTVGYWASQQPRTSREQLKHLLYVFEPDLVKGKYLELLEKVRIA